jgi:hypothetical protein
MPTFAPQGYLRTGQVTCHDAAGAEIACAGSGQDAEFCKGIPWPAPRYVREGELVLDRLTGLYWTRDANPGELPRTWAEALELVAQMNRDRTLGFSDWRLPNRRELRSLVSHQTRRPTLPPEHPFINVFTSWYWTSTTAAVSPSHAWYVNLDGARMFYGGKDQSFLLWPVRGVGHRVLSVTGQIECYDTRGRPTPCAGSGQDGELRTGGAWPVPHFQAQGDAVIDRMTGLVWRRDTDLAHGPVSWEEALAAVAALNRTAGGVRWRLPNINELESLVDCSVHGPALTRGHPFFDLREVYWSSTTSAFEPDWAWALYLDKGAVGVGQKGHARFHVWAVRDAGECLPADAGNRQR